MELVDAVNKVNNFKGYWLADKLASIEKDFVGSKLTTLSPLFSKYQIDVSLLEAADTVKGAASQIDEVIHAVGILNFLPNLLHTGEVIESLSLGAGNTGKPFDLVTNLRIAEFKFIYWKGGSESIRQNQFFKDFFYLAESDTNKKRCLYVLEKDAPVKFLNGGRAIKSVLSKDIKLSNLFKEKYGDKFLCVRDYYNSCKNKVEIIDLHQITKKINGI